MEYYIIRVYRREPRKIIAGQLRDTRLTGVVETHAGRKELFHDAETLWRLLTCDTPASVSSEPENSG